MSSSNYCFLTCTQVSQEAGQVVWYSHLFQNFPQFIVIHTIKGFGIVNKAEIDVLLELSCIFNDPADVGNLISVSSAFSKTSLNIWKSMVHILLKPGLENFEHYFISMWDECNCVVVWAFFGIAFLYAADCNNSLWTFHFISLALTGFPSQVKLFNTAAKVTGLPRWLSSKESTCNAGVTGDTGLNPGLGRSPEGGHGKPLQYSCLESSIDKGASWATDHGVAKSWYNWSYLVCMPQGDLPIFLFSEILDIYLKVIFYIFQNNNRTITFFLSIISNQGFLVSYILGPMTSCRVKSWEEIWGQDFLFSARLGFVLPLSLYL